MAPGNRDTVKGAVCLTARGPAPPKQAWDGRLEPPAPWSCRHSRLPRGSRPAGEDAQGIGSGLPSSQPHSPASHPPPTGSLSSGLCDPSDIRAIQPLPPFVCTSPGPAPFFKGLAPATSQPQPSPWRTAKSMQMPSQALSPAHLHQSPWSLPRTLPGSSPHNYTLDTAIAWRCSASLWELF